MRFYHCENLKPPPLAREGNFVIASRAFTAWQSTKNFCHTERSEVSQKTIDCYANAIFYKVAFARNDDTMLDCHAQQVALAMTIFFVILSVSEISLFAF